MKCIRAHKPNSQKTMDYSLDFIFGLVSDLQAGLVLANVPLGIFANNEEKTP